MSNHAPNIYEFLKPEFQVYDSVLDVGCGELYDLVCFENSQFKDLIGIADKFQTNDFGAYNRRIKERDNISVEPDSFRRNNYTKFKKRYKVHQIDLNNFHFEDNHYSLIICNKVLHFFNDDRKFDLIRTFFNSLQQSGLLYLKINHNRHPNNTDLTITKKIAENTYQNLKEPFEIRYLIEPSLFLNKLMDFQILEKYTIEDDRTLSIVIRK